MTDFIGFTYNGYHSVRNLKIYRTSQSSRYEEDIMTSAQDKTLEVPGKDGKYYFGTTKKNKIFNISFAFEDLQETDLLNLKQVFKGNGIHELVFDETPYKAWSAKVTNISLKHVCFEKNNIRTYKGEGNITFTCYYPYAHTPTKLWTVANKGTSAEQWTYVTKDGRCKDEYSIEAYPNRNEWLVDGILSEIDLKTRYQGFAQVYGYGDRKIPYSICVYPEEPGQELTLDRIEGVFEGSTFESPTFVITPLSVLKIEYGQKIVFDSKIGLLTKETDSSREIIPFQLTGEIKPLEPHKNGNIFPITSPSMFDRGHIRECNYKYEYL